MTNTWRTGFWVVVLGFIFVNGSLLAEELRLVCLFEGRVLTPVGVDQQGRIKVRDGDAEIAVPLKARWMVEGDIAGHADRFEWAPTCTLQRTMEPEATQKPETPYLAKITPGCSAQVEVPGKTSAGNFVSWPQTDERRRIAVFAWIVAGKIVQVEVGTTPRGEFLASHTFRLTAGEVAGQGIAGLWDEGLFEKPRPLFSDPVLYRAFVASVLDDATGLEPIIRERPQLGRVTGEAGYSLLHYASEAGANGAIQALLKGDPKARMAAGKSTPLHWAARAGRDSAVQLLLAAGFEKNAVDASRRTSLLEAAAGGHLAVVTRLLAARADVNATSDDFRTAFGEALDRGYADVVERLARRMDDPLPNSPQNQNVLRSQAGKGHTAMVRWMLERYVSPNSEQPGYSALALAATNGHREIVEVLIARKASLKWADEKRGFTALIMASSRNEAGCVEALLKAGAEVGARSKAGGTALHAAAAADAAEAVEMLLAHGANPGDEEKRGFTPLELALRGSCGKAAAALAKAGGRLNVRDPELQEHLEAALFLDQSEVVSRAMDDGWSPNGPLKSGWPALAVAEILGASRCVDVLRAAGASVDARPFDVAMTSELDEPVKVVAIEAPVDPRELYERSGGTGVKVEMLVDGEGRVLFPRVKQRVDPRVVPRVIEAVSHARFTAPRRAGKPVATKLVFRCDFEMEPDQEYEAGRVDALPKVIEQVRPIYPVAARREGVQARAVVDFVVDRNGRVRDARVFEQTGPAFGEAALVAVNQWRFTPGILKGRPVAVRMRVPLIFGLKD